MKKDIMKEIELKFEESLNFPKSQRLIKELFQLCLELRRIIIKQNVQIPDGESYDLYNLEFLTKTKIFTITYVKKFSGIFGWFDKPEIIISILEEKNLKIYNLTQEKLELINL